MKHLRLAKVSTMEAANEFLEKEYWPEWNESFAAPQWRIFPIIIGR